MKYILYKQHPEGCNYPQLNIPWEVIGSFESDTKVEDMSISYAVRQVTGRSMEPAGTWYEVLPEDRKPNYYIDQDGRTVGRPRESGRW